MSLLVWLPLNGDLRNLGCSDYSFTTIETPTYTTGKIGQCYQRANSNTQLTNGININSNLLDILGTEASIAVWVKPLGTHTHYNGTIVSSGNWNAKKWAFGVSQDNSQVDVLCGGYNNYITCSVPVNEWTHLVSTFNNGICKLYKNGVYIGEKTGQAAFASDASNACIGRETYASGYFGFNGCINDVRIYNHCLSAAEVREIAMGLVLHYKLNGGLFGNPNLLARYVVPGQAAPTSTANGGRTTWLGDYKITIPATENADTYFRLFMTEQLISGTTYTISCKVSGLLNGSYYRFPLFAQNNTSMGVLTIDHNGLCSLTFTMNWTGTQTAATGINGETVYVNFLDDSGRSLVSGQGAITLYDFKLEKGNTVTPWCPADSELAIDRTIVSDSSGYGHNGTITGNIITNFSTPRYNVSTNFPDSACSIGIGNLSTMIPEGIFTFNIWFKKLTGEWSSKSYETILGGPSGFELEAKVSSTNSPVLKYYSWGGGTTNYTLDEWHMLTMVRTTSNTKFYLDGELKVTGSAGSIPSGSYFIGAWSNALGQNYRGYLSDARIYCTPLLDNDIKMLYNVSMKVDNLGRVHTFEFDEKDNNFLAGTMITASYGNRINPYTKYNSNGELYFDTNGSSAGSDYIPINPTNHTYYYDFDISVNAGNQFYIGFERYDANKTSRSNNACTYIYASNSSTDINHKHISGTVNLSTDGVNPCAFIALRILNGWSGTTSGVIGTATIHSMSLREISTIQNLKSYKNGILSTSEFKEYQKAAFYKNGFVEATEFIEI